MNSIKLFLILFSCFSIKLNAQVPNLIWAKQIEGGNHQLVRSIFVDENDYVYVVGDFLDTADFDPGNGTFIMTSTIYSDVYVSKFDPFGNFVWAKKIEGNGAEYGYSIKVDNADFVYITGSFDADIDCDPGPSSFILSSPSSVDAFICKLSPTGEFVWAKSLVNSHFNVARDLALDSNGSVYITGSFNGTVDFDPGPGVYNLISASPSNSFDDVFILKLTSSGDFVWAKQLACTGEETGRAINIDGNGDVYVTGSCYGNIDFDPGISGYSTLCEGAFICKFDSNGNFIWAKAFNGSYQMMPFSICADNDNNVLITGYFEDTMDFDPGFGYYPMYAVDERDAFICKLDQSGNFLWARQVGGVYFDSGFSINSDIDNNIYAAGAYYETLEFEPGTSGDVFTSQGSADIFINKLNQNGDLIWMKSLGGTGDETSPKLFIPSSGEIYVTGSFRNMVDFDPGLASYNFVADDLDAYIFYWSENTSLNRGKIQTFGLELYPNPTNNGSFKIIFGNLIENAEIVVFNSIGKVVLSQSFEDVLDIDIILNQASGIYYVNIISEKKEPTTIKIVVD